MKHIPSQLLAMALVPAAVFGFDPCPAAPAGLTDKGRTVAASQAEPAGVTVDTFQVTGTITRVDHLNGYATLEAPDGKKTLYKSGPDAFDFIQFHVGDRLKATVTQQLVVSMREKGEASTNRQDRLIALAPKGAKPEGVMAKTIEITNRVKSVEFWNRKATLEFPDGSIRTVAVLPDVKLSAFEVGREVVIEATEAIALLTEKD